MLGTWTEESEILERQHTRTTTAMYGEAKTGEGEQQQHTRTTKMSGEESTGEAEQQDTAVTAAHKEETIDSEDQELVALIETEKIWTE